MTDEEAFKNRESSTGPTFVLFVIVSIVLLGLGADFLAVSLCEILYEDNGFWGALLEAMDKTSPAVVSVNLLTVLGLSFYVYARLFRNGVRAEDRFTVILRLGEIGIACLGVVGWVLFVNFSVWQSIYLRLPGMSTSGIAYVIMPVYAGGFLVVFTFVGSWVRGS